jgi:hypothetical protein
VVRGFEPPRGGPVVELVAQLLASTSTWGRMRSGYRGSYQALPLSSAMTAGTMVLQCPGPQVP